jgi:hypothetical protein
VLCDWCGIRCPTLKTAISDIEVDSESLSGATLKKLPGRAKPVEFGVMHRILYKVSAIGDEWLWVITDRWASACP